jgi:hypothetical protein
MRASKIMLLLMTTTFILFRLPISLLLVELFSMTNGSIEVPASILMNNVILSKVILNLIVFIYLLNKLYVYLKRRFNDTDTQIGLVVVGSALSLSYVIFDASQVYHIFK